MINARKITRRILCSTALLTGVISPAMAQEAPAPEEYRNVDEHGVDLVTGTFNAQILEGSIGPADGGVSMVRYYGQSGYRDNWSGDLRKINEGGQFFIVITFGEMSERFKKVGSSWVAVKANGATLTETGFTNPYMPHYIYTSANGTVIDYTDPKLRASAVLADTIEMPSSFCETANALGCGLPTSIRQPDGVQYSLEWRVPRQCPAPSGGPGGFPPIYTDLPPADGGAGGGDPEGADPCTVTYRLQDVRSNSGYAMKIKYGSDNDSQGGTSLPPSPWWDRVSLKFMDLSQVSCPAFATNCDGVAGSWPTVTYAYSYSAPVYVTQITNSQSGTWRVENNTSTRETRIRRPGSVVDDTVVNRSPTTGKVISITDEGATETYNWATGSGGAPTVTSTDGTGASTTVNTSPATPQPAAAINGAGQATSYTYDTSGRVTRITQPEGDYVNFTRDARGNITQTLRKAKPGSSDADIITSANFDVTCSNVVKCNQPNYTIDAKGNRTDYTYDITTGVLTNMRLPAATNGAVRPEINYGWTDLYAQVLNGSGILVNAGTPQRKLTQMTVCSTAATCAGSANETKVTLAYDTPNLLTSSVTTAAGDGSVSSTTSYVYDARDNLSSVDGPLPGSSDVLTYIYDSLDRRIGEIGPDPDGAGIQLRAATRYTFDTASRVTKVEGGTVTAATAAALNAMAVLQTVDIAYDANGNAIKQTVSGTAGATQVVQLSYDADNRLTCTALRMNPAVFVSLPASACTMGTEGVGANAFGKDRITKNIYDSAGRVTKVQTALGTAEVADEVTTAYTANGQNAFVIDAENNRTTYEYDGHDRGYKVRFPVPTTGANTTSTTDYIQIAFDDNSNVTSRRLRDGATIGFAYDNLNRRTYKDLPGSETDVSYGYDLMGRATSITQGQTLGFAFDALGRNSSQTSSFGTTNYLYDAAGRRTRITYPAASGAGSLFIDYDYDSEGKVTKIRENGATTGAGVLASYAYDAQGRGTAISFGNGTVQSVAFDAAQRLSSLTNNLAGTSADQTISFAYNPAGQIASQTRSNDSYAWTGHYNVDRSYTANGMNQLINAGGTVLGYDARGNLASSGSDTYGYSSENLLTSGPGGAILNYDPLGRLHDITKVGTTRFLYDGTDMIGEYNTSGAVLKRYVHGPGVDNPIVWYEGAGLADKRYLLGDERGSITSVSGASGSVIATNAYDEYGIPMATNLGRFQYTGQTWLPELGMYYYKARIYSPTLGRFMQTDPIGYADGMNWYNYVGSDPVNFVDPSGLNGEPPGKDGKCKGTSTKGSDGLCYKIVVSQAKGVDFGGFVGGGGSFGGGGAVGNGWGPSKAKPEKSAPTKPETQEIVVSASRIVETFSSIAPGLLVAPPLYTVYFGFPPEPNSAHHIDRHLTELTEEEKNALKRYITGKLQSGFSGKGRYGFSFRGRNYEAGVYEVGQGKLNVGTIFEK